MGLSELSPHTRPQYHRQQQVAPRLPVDGTVALRGWIVASWVFCVLILGSLPVTGLSEFERPWFRRVARRVGVPCGGDALNGFCAARESGAICSGDPASPLYDADCFTGETLRSPKPDAACRLKGEPCEIHVAINRMGSMYESQAYDNDVMLGVILAYWDAKYWDLSDRWGAHGLDGYVVYAIVRCAMRFHQEIEIRPTTRLALEYMLRDHADRGLPTTVDNGERWFHGGENAWNTWSEDYLAFALGYAAADAWFASAWYEGPYFGDYYEKVGEAVNLTFSISHREPQTLRFEIDADPLIPADRHHVMIRNHGEYSPVYAMAIIARLWDINSVYQAASLPARYDCFNKPDTLDALYEWLTLKIEPNPVGSGYVFRTDACERNDGEISFCDDRRGDPEGSPGDQREPGHYPLDRIMPAFCVTDHLEYFGPSCDFVGPAGIAQREFNYYFNCVFQFVE